MLKNILALEGAQQLTKNEQKTINGGLQMCGTDLPNCQMGYECIGRSCRKILL